MKYLLACFSWFLFLFVSGRLLEAASGWRRTAFFSSSTTLHILSIVTPVIILIFFGVLLSGRHLLRAYRTEGHWRINLPRFNILCLLPIVIVMLIKSFYDEISTVVDIDRFDFQMITTFVLILFGYYFSQSLYKRKN
ncbi:hypothetical protein ACFFHM_14900 [Halalkalibacter kiskunsagensis]|uniref:Uncharacterized protein n=1 Tax=Halalkalibacter kiskunsagensis TaxID=1548599 RepID=A0ABV6KI95_9BACI